jgi:hypothetical protein
MEDIVGIFASKFGLPPEVAKQGMSMVSKAFLQNAEPDKASGLMSNLPSGLTDMFSDDDKRQFTTTKQNVPQGEIIKKLSHECSHDDKEASQKVYQEIINVLRERTGRDRQAVLQDILANLKKSSICSFSCAFEFG